MPTGGDTNFRREALQMTRLNNLITARSDTFTCYLVIQGWLNPGTPSATLALERCYCFIADRSADPRNPRLLSVPMRR